MSVSRLALSSAAGVVDVVAVEMIPRALEAEPAWAIVLAFVLGGVFYTAVDWGIQWLKDRLGEVKPAVRDRG